MGDDRAFFFSSSCGVYLYFPHQIQIELLLLFAFTPPPPPRVRRTEAKVSSADAVCSSCGTTNTTSIFLRFLRLLFPLLLPHPSISHVFPLLRPCFPVSACVRVRVCVSAVVLREGKERVWEIEGGKPSTAQCSKKKKKWDTHSYLIACMQSGGMPCPHTHSLNCTEEFSALFCRVFFPTLKVLFFSPGKILEY